MARHQLFLFSVPCIAGARRGHGDADSAPPSPQVKISVDSNFVYDTTGNLIEDKYLQGESSKNALVHFYCRTAVYCALRNSKLLKISYDWRGMPIEFTQYPPQEKREYPVILCTKWRWHTTVRAGGFPRPAG